MRAAPRTRPPAVKLSEVMIIPMTMKMPAKLLTEKRSCWTKMKIETRRVAALNVTIFQGRDAMIEQESFAGLELILLQELKRIGHAQERPV